MTGSVEFSRLVRLGEHAMTMTPDAVEARFRSATVEVRLEPALSDPATREIFASAADQLSRFCGTVLRDADAELMSRCLERDLELHPDRPSLHSRTAVGQAHPELIVSVAGRNPGTNEITVSAEGWVGRICGQAGTQPEPFAGPANLVGAMVAAHLVSGEVFLRLLTPDRPRRNIEVSAWTGESGQAGALETGPELPATLPRLDGLLVGCGNVGNGFVDALRRLTLPGRLRLVDRQGLGEENLGPYLLASRLLLGKPKTQLIEQALRGRIETLRHDEPLQVFIPRISQYQQFPVPPIVINGLDNVHARHSMQRLWPDNLLDMAAGGTTAQVLLHRRGSGGQCLLGAFVDDAHSSDDFDGMVAKLTGLQLAAIEDDLARPINRDDVTAAPPHLRHDLEEARRTGTQVCGYISQHFLVHTDEVDTFAGAAPFVGGLAGARAAALAVKILVGESDPSGLHWQFDFTSGRARNLVMRCAPSCDCARAADLMSERPTSSGT